MNFPRIIYALQHNPTGKVYVGSTTHLWQRTKSHLYALRNGKHIISEMQRDFEEHGDDYSVFVLDVAFNRDEARKEYEWMDILKSRNPQHGYNKQEVAAPFRLSERRVELKVPSSFEGYGNTVSWDGDGWPLEGKGG